MQIARKGPSGGGGKRSKKAKSSSGRAACGNCSTRRTPSFLNASQDSWVTPIPMVAARAVSRSARSLVANARTLSRISSKTRAHSGNSDKKEGGADSAAPTGPQTNGTPRFLTPHGDQYRPKVTWCARSKPTCR